jgi:predicted XRE-type DNA-binding protein
MEDYTISSGNVFEDMGFADAEEKLAKAKLAAVINKIIEQKDFTEAETAKILGLNQPKISALKNGRLKGFSIESLFFFLEALDQHIEITITHKSKTSIEPRINVAYV